MFSTPSPASGPKAIATNALRKAGLMDTDTRMRDAEKDRPGGKKASHKSRRRPRPNESMKEQISGSLQQSLATRTTSSARAGPSESLSVMAAARVRRRDGMKDGPVEAWRRLVNKRYDPDTRFLNLESIIDDELVKKFSLVPPGHGGDSRTGAVIFKLAAELKPEVQTLSLANNNITGFHLTYLDRYLPRLHNLSLQGNSIKQWRDLDAIAGKRDRMKHLRELVLTGTPLRDGQYKSGRGDRYRSEVARRFPALEVLDSEAITQIGFTNDPTPGSTPAVPKPSSTTFPCEMGGPFISGVDGSLVSNFLFRFFQMFDTQRGGLLDVYDPQANFSYCCNTSIPARARIENLHNTMPNQRKLTWESWLNNAGGGSRNLSRSQVSLDKMVQVLHTGASKIVTAQAALPETKHDVQGAISKFVVDAFPVPHGESSALLLTLHGEFMEVPSQGMRSFDRSFILLPAPEGSIAKLSGWDVVILSDQLTIRGYSNPNAWKVGPMLVQAEAKSKVLQKSAEFSASSLPLAQQQALNTLPQTQQSLVLRVCERTKLNANYAVDCLTNNAWDFERAIAIFEQVKDTLPKDAFL